MERQHKLLDFSQVELKAGPTGQGRIKGYAATFGNVDRQNDVIVKGAFADTLDFFKESGFVAQGHDAIGLPAATIDQAYEDDYGLWIEADFHSTPEAQAMRTVAQERIKRGKTVTLSIGYGINEDGVEFRDDGVRVLKSLTVYEVSFANIPANPRAEVAGVKTEAAAVSDASFDDRVAALVANAGEIATLGKRMHEVRQKENRVLSAANRRLIADAVDALDAIDPVKAALRELLAATEPAPRDPDKRRGAGAGSTKQSPYRARLQEMEAWAQQHGLVVAAASTPDKE